MTAWKERWNGLTTPRTVQGANARGQKPPNENAKCEGETVISRLQPSALPPKAGRDPVQLRREYSNYLSPKLGFFSVDTWTLAAAVARNMILNWLVFIPLLMCALALPRIVLSLARLGDTCDLWYVPSVSQWFGYLRFVVPMLGAVFFAIGVLNVLRYLPGVGGKDHTQGKFLKYCFAPIFLAALALLTTHAWLAGRARNTSTALTLCELCFSIRIPGAVGYAAFLVFCWRRVRDTLFQLTNTQPVRHSPYYTLP